MGAIEIRETDEVGRPTTTYLISAGKDSSERVDIIPSINGNTLSQRLLALFLPTGYPHTVSEDYTSYQIYDSLQAFSSAIASLLASRAVLQGLGVGDENASATAAMLLSVVQESLGRFATIFFAHWASRRIEAECKMYRLAADIFNDCAFVMDCLSPSLPKPIRIPLLCASSMFRAICGVTGGSSKAILSTHFAKANNIGELNAKDSSQETVISLLGMWAGSFVVSHVHSGFATWIWLVSLLSLHLGTNYAAVSGVCMTTLNRQRANIVFSTIISENRVLSPMEVAKQERIFDWDGILRWCGGTAIGYCKIGATFEDMLRAIRAPFNKSSGSVTDISLSMARLLNIFKQEHYLLWFEIQGRKTIIVLKHGAGVQTQLKAWSLAVRISEVYRSAADAKVDIEHMMFVLENNLKLNNASMARSSIQLEDAGWDLATVQLQTTSGTLLHVQNSDEELSVQI